MTASVRFPGPPTLEGGVCYFDDSVTVVSEAKTDFVPRRLRQLLTNAQPGFLLHRLAFLGLPEDGVEAEYIPEPPSVDKDGKEGLVLARGRTSSKHIVSFGQLYMTAPEIRERASLVACKPLDTIAQACNEFGASQYVNSLDFGEGRPRAFEPLGFFKSAAKKVYLLTEYHHSTVTLDTTLWDPGYAPTRRELENSLSHGALSIADLHSNGMAHLDYLAKNSAADTVGIRWPDLESARRFAVPGHELTDTFTASEWMRNDLMLFLGSYRDWPDGAVDKYFTEPYRDITSQPNSLVNPLVLPAAEDIRLLAQQGLDAGLSLS